MTRLGSGIDPRSRTFAHNKDYFENLLNTFRERIAIASAGGSIKLRDRHHARGKYLVRDRIDRLVDPGTPFLELSTLAAWGQYNNAVPSVIPPKISGVHEWNFLGIIN